VNLGENREKNYVQTLKFMVKICVSMNLNYLRRIMEPIYKIEEPNSTWNGQISHFDGR
jgi:hypothetical protein